MRICPIHVALTSSLNKLLHTAVFKIDAWRNSLVLYVFVEREGDDDVQANLESLLTFPFYLSLTIFTLALLGIIFDLEKWQRKVGRGVKSIKIALCVDYREMMMIMVSCWFLQWR